MTLYKKGTGYFIQNESKIVILNMLTFPFLLFRQDAGLLLLASEHRAFSYLGYNIQTKEINRPRSYLLM